MLEIVILFTQRKINANSDIIKSKVYRISTKSDMSVPRTSHRRNLQRIENSIDIRFSADKLKE